MKLLNHLFEIIAFEANDPMRCRIRLMPDSIIYQAHFPGNPITPGVCIISMATEILSIKLGRDLKLDSISNAKFISVISPLENQEIIYEFRKIDLSDSKNVKTQVLVLNNEGKVFSKLSIRFKL